MFIVAAWAMMLGAAGGDSARAEFTACLKSSVETGSKQKVAAPAFTDFAKTSCAAQLAGFRNAVIAYDVKAGWTRKKAEPDADSQVGDYLGEWSDHYRDLGSITASK